MNKNQQRLPMKLIVNIFQVLIFKVFDCQRPNITSVHLFALTEQKLVNELHKSTEISQFNTKQMGVHILCILWYELGQHPGFVSKRRPINRIKLIEAQ